MEQGFAVLLKTCALLNLHIYTINAINLDVTLVSRNNPSMSFTIIVLEMGSLRQSLVVPTFLNLMMCTAVGKFLGFPVYLVEI